MLPSFYYDHAYEIQPEDESGDRHQDKYHFNNEIKPVALLPDPPTQKEYDPRKQ
jgi:hypothetical protein